MRYRLLKLAFVLVAALLPFAAQCQDVAVPKRVLVLYSYSRLVPGNVAVDRGLRAALSRDVAQPPRTYSEFLDTPEFSGTQYEQLMVSYLRGKYADAAPQVIVVVSEEALRFVIKYRGELFPQAPIVHAAVSPAILPSFADLPADVIGVPLRYDYSGTIAQALRWSPAAHRLIIVTGANELDHIREARLRREVPAVAGAVKTEFWTGLPASELQRRLHGLTPDAVVFTPGFFQDGVGKQFTPRDAAVLIAEASSAPVYGSYDTFIGIGVVGGRMPSFEGVGDQAGQIVKALMAGESPAALHLPTITPSALHIDWRQVQRWGISQAALPPDTIVHFKKPTLWEAYRTQVLVAAAILAVQSLMIAALYIERRRRSEAEATNLRMHNEVAHVSRRAVAGELTASIAHEINQPLGAIQTAADAADLMLQSGADRREDLIRIVGRLRRDSLRASEVIRRLRTLLAKAEPERRPFNAADAVADVAMMLKSEAERRDITLVVASAPPRAPLIGDQTQFQQLLLNLVMNAMDAVADLPVERRHVEISLTVAGQNVLIAVTDRGPGITAEALPKLFDSFFTTKQRGMGLGLSIARSIVESCGGKIWAENGVVDGAAFFVEIPSTDLRGSGRHT